MASTQNYLSLISQYESGNQNIPNYQYDATHTAQGYYQITNSNWNAYAPLVGINTTQYPNAMSAPANLQTQVANYMLTETPAGISNWSDYNPQLLSALSAAGMQTSGTVSGGIPGSNTQPLIDLSGSGATASTSDILSSIESSISSVDLTNPTADIALLAAAGVALYLMTT